MLRRNAIILFVLFCTVILILQVKIPETKALTSITVPDDYSTIQQAINHAHNGDTIYIKTGIYSENVIFPDGLSNVIILGQDKLNSILQGTFSYSGYLSSHIQLVDFTITGEINIVCISGTPQLLTIYGCNLGSNINTDGATECTFTLNTIAGTLSLVGQLNNFRSSNNVITSNTFQNFGISFGLSSSNIIEYNTITNAQIGINEVASYHQEAIIKYNNINNCGVGIAGTSIFDDIEQNNIAFNMYGMQFSTIMDSTILHNNFVGNTHQISISSALSQHASWNDTASGNYWSDYSGSDGNHDGIGDTPYIIDSNNQDNYPLMMPYGNQLPINTVPEVPVGTIVASSVTILSLIVYVAVKKNANGLKLK
jgi:nitrous oxidase accessory protein